jgi:hypothetical protein
MEEYISRLGMEFEVAGEKFKIDEFCEEPNTGLVIITQTSHHSAYRFGLPVILVEEILQQQKAHGPALAPG